jgi:hypothetical protein
MLVGGHERDGVHQDAELMSAHGERVEIQPSDVGVRAKEVMAAKRAARDQHGAAWKDEAGFSHAARGEQKAGQVPKA